MTGGTFVSFGSLAVSYKNTPVIGSLAEVYRYLTMPVCQICHFQTSSTGCSNVASLGIC